MKPYSIYRHKKTDPINIWHMHRAYDTFDKGFQAWRDMTKRPRKLRVWIYAFLPTVNANLREFEADRKLTEMLNKGAR